MYQTHSLSVFRGKCHIFCIAIGWIPQVRGAISAIKYTEHFPRLPADFEISGDRDADLFDLLEHVFGFQVCIDAFVIICSQIRY